MKKRSLVAALAMLVVSAIVLTSSTYAWFASNSSAEVDDISAKVANNSGNLLLQATGAYAVEGAKPTVKLTANDYNFKRGDSGNTMQPVSMSIAEGDVSFKKVSFGESKFTAISDASGDTDYITYQFTAKYDNGTNGTKAVYLAPDFSASGAAFTYGLIKVTDNTKENDNVSFYLYDNVAGEYTPIVSFTGEITDDGDSVIDNGDTGFEGANVVFGSYEDADKNPADSITIMNVESGKTGTAIIDVYVWAEGQDPQCSGPVASEGGFGFTVSAQQ